MFQEISACSISVMTERFPALGRSLICKKSLVIGGRDCDMSSIVIKGIVFTSINQTASNDIKGIAVCGPASYFDFKGVPYSPIEVSVLGSHVRTVEGRSIALDIEKTVGRSYLMAP